MAEEYQKSRGVVIRFNNQKGYGFIKPDDGGDDLFVHHSDIKSEGFRTLRKNQYVEFFVLVDDQKNKTKAGDVSIIKDSPIKNVPNGVELTGVKAKGIDCYNCGKHGHIAKNCYTTDGCYNCCLVGHFAKDCPNASFCLNCDGEFGHVTRDCKNARSRGDGACYSCGGIGHFARDCTSVRGSSNGGGGDGGDSRDRGKCFNCNKEGHYARNCPNTKK